MDLALPDVRPVGRLEQFAYDRAERDRDRLPGLGYYFDDTEADEIVELIESDLKHHKGEWAGKPFILSDHQKFIVREAFGWKRADGTRRFREVYIEVPRKDGKTEVAAAVGIVLTVADGEAGAEVYSSATKRDQAKIVHTAAKAMVKQSPSLMRHVRVLTNNISHEGSGSKFEPLGSDGDSMDGLNAHGNILDELHAHKNRKVYDVLQTSMGTRRQPLTWMITTAGVYDPTSIGWEMHEYAVKVLEGVFQDEAFFAFIATSDEGDDWTKPATWWKANPNLGITSKVETIAREVEKAKNRPSYENTVRRYYLNEWTEQVTRWLSMDAWRKCGGGLTEAQLLGLPCYGGLDLSQKLDLTAFSLVFPPESKNDPVRVLMRYWLPEEIAKEAAKVGRVPYDAWMRDGWITPTPGNVIDYDFVRADINALGERFGIMEIGFDPWSATQMSIKLTEDGYTMVPVRQGTRSLSEPSKDLEARVVQGPKGLLHGDNPVLTWNASNVAVRSDTNGNIAPDKDKAAGKIDGVVALIIAMSRMIVHETKRPSRYEQHGIRVI
jgi:phage terminase large subunit-like protein